MSLDLELYSQLASSREDENYRFRAFLKTRDPEEVDKFFKVAHEYMFNRIDCNECRNCCKEYVLELSKSELNTISETTGMDKSIAKKDDEGNYIIKASPCLFLKENKCSIEDCKPLTCRNYPGTDKPGRVWRMLSIIDKSLVCPAVFKILEYVKEEYKFIHEVTPLPYFFDRYYDGLDDENCYIDEDEGELPEFRPVYVNIDTGSEGIVEVAVADMPYEWQQVITMNDEYSLNEDKKVLDKYFLGLSIEEKLLKILAIRSLLLKLENCYDEIDKRNKEIKKLKKQKKQNKKNARKSTIKNRK